MPDVTCSGCGASWTRDPALEVPCPTCHAKIGSRCVRPSGHGCELHADRDRAAMAAGILQMCSAGPTATRPRQLQMEIAS